MYGRGGRTDGDRQRHTHKSLGRTDGGGTGGRLFGLVRCLHCDLVGRAELLLLHLVGCFWLFFFALESRLGVVWVAEYI